MQAVSKFMYLRGVPRYQTSLVLKVPRLFFHFNMAGDHLKRWNHTLFMYDPATSSSAGYINLPKNWPFSLQDAQIVQFLNCVLCFKS